MDKSVFRLTAIVIVQFILSSCNQGNKTQSADQVQAAPQVVVNPPAFNFDSAYVYTQDQVDFGPRNMNTKAHDACGDWLIAKMKKIADTVYIQKFDATGFDGTKLKCTNIIASFNPKATTRILLTSHWDSRPWADQDTKDRDKPILAACDGASGVATLMEVANDIRIKPVNIGIDIFFNDAEDYGYSNSLKGLVKAEGGEENSFCLGTQYWANHPQVKDYKADFGILLDMAAARNAVFTREGVSSYYAGWVLDKVWANAALLGYSNLFSSQNTPEITDDHYYINTIAKVPTIDIIHTTPTGFGPYWHTHNDNMDIIDKGTLDAVGRTLLYTIYQYDAEHKAVQ